ncbi:MAG: phosphoesterase [Myxococcales bacterium]|nr:phosphoesterase [Myxococcales bacterium]
MLSACSAAGNPTTTPDATDPNHHDAAVVNVDGDMSGHDALTPLDGPSTTAKPTVFTIVLENMDYNEIVGSSNAPYLNSLIAAGGLATNYKDTGHPSLPNYLHMISGANQYPGFIDVGPNFIWFPANVANLGTQLQAAHIKWRSYQESMGSACNLSDNGNYATKHDPFIYFQDMQTGTNGVCAATNVDFTNFAADLATNDYRYMWITPNLIHDGHDPATDPVAALHTADTWMSTVVPSILASQGYTAGGVLLITWDESEGRNGDDPDKIPMVILSPKLKAHGMTSSVAYTHASYLATVEDLLSLPRLPSVTATPSMKTDFLMP